MNYCEQIEDALDCYKVLDIFGIEYEKGKRIPCPVHKGDGNNFSLSGNGQYWTCFSRNCGEGVPRGAINLYCFIEHGKPFTELDNRDKFKCMQLLCGLAGIEFSTIDKVDWKEQKLRKMRNAALTTFFALQNSGLTKNEIKQGIDRACPKSG